MPQRQSTGRPMCERLSSHSEFAARVQTGMSTHRPGRRRLISRAAPRPVCLHHRRCRRAADGRWTWFTKQFRPAFSSYSAVAPEALSEKFRDRQRHTDHAGRLRLSPDLCWRPAPARQPSLTPPSTSSLLPSFVSVPQTCALARRWKFDGTLLNSCRAGGGSPNDGWSGAQFAGGNGFSSFFPTVLDTYTYTLDCVPGAISVPASATVTIEAVRPMSR